MNNFPIAFAETVHCVDDESALAAYYAMICDEDGFPSLQNSKPSAAPDWQVIKKQDLEEDELQHTFTPVKSNDHDPSNAWHRIDTMDAPYAEIAEKAVDLPAPESHRVFFLPRVTDRKQKINVDAQQQNGAEDVDDETIDLWALRKGHSVESQRLTDRRIRRERQHAIRWLDAGFYDLETVQRLFDQRTPTNILPINEQQGKMQRKLDWIVRNNWHSKFRISKSAPRREQLVVGLAGEEELEKALRMIPEHKLPESARMLLASNLDPVIWYLT
ncbi:hypothetical protein EC973_002393 [Apophysomyces ossiformis]|uniref:Uncharacterized protein n=1 Tax=Apophysomyces ossiformis TaxID=679940 RepID=A0A8H7BMZ2_9FUNG|nr:hypothetical protein EC973_002393 [Apophysomyces ossiformis]